MSELIGPGSGAAIWVAAAATLAAWSILVGARRPFAWSQRLLAGLLTGYLALVAIREVLVPRLLLPLDSGSGERPLLFAALVLAAMLVAARWLPRWMATIPIAVIVGATAAFAIGGAVVGTVLPQIAGVLPAPGSGTPVLLGAMLTALVASLVLLSFLHGRPQGRLLGGLSSAGRWLLLGGLGAWLGYLVLARLALLTDRLGFLTGDWLGLGR